ncbi:MAG: exodeoxyribonuclease V subunit gamma [Acidobacteria bacterium]|nr:exodeoxyribonuclease V subunit gamma [Acidobacteriota bacterium]
MERLVLLHGPAHAGRGSIFLDECTRRIRENRFRSLVYLVPSRRRADQIKSELARVVGSFLEPPIHTFNDFVLELYLRVPDRGILIDSQARATLLEEILVEGRDQYPYLLQGRERPHPGLVRRLAEWIAELKNHLYTSESFPSALRAVRGSLDNKDHELCRVFSEYHQKLKAHALVDPEGTFQLVELLLEGPNASSLFEGKELLLLDGFYDFTPAEEKILDRMFRHFPEVRVRMDYLPRPRVFAPAERLYRKFASLASGLEEVPRKADDWRVPMDWELFEPWEPGPEGLSLGGHVVLRAARDRRDEVEILAQSIKTTLLEQPGLLPESVAVVFRDLHPYLPFLRELFPQYGIPFSLYLGERLAETPVAVAALAALDARLQDFHREAVLRVLASPYVTFQFSSEEPGALTLEFDAVSYWARKLSVVRGRADWINRIDGELDRLRSRLSRYQEGDYDPDLVADVETARQRLSRELRSLSRLRQGIIAFFDFLEEWQDELDGQTFRQQFLQLLERLNLRQNLASFYEEDLPADRRGILLRDSVSMEKLCGALDQLVWTVSFSARKSLPLPAWVDLLRVALAEARLPEVRAEGQGVQVMEVLEIRQLDFHIIYLGGLVEGEFPSAGRGDIFYDDSVRSALGLRRIRDQAAEERYLFYTCVTAPCERLVLTCSLSDREEPLVRSFFVDEMRRRFALEEPPLSQDPLHRKGLQLQLGARLCEAAAPDGLLAWIRSPDPEHREWLCQGLAALDVSRQRLSGLKSVFSGQVSSETGLEVIAQGFGEDHVFSISQVENYARCPFAYFSSYVLGLEPLPEPEEELTPLTRGEILHRIVYRFYEERRSEKAPPLSWLRHPERDTARARLKAIAREELARLRFQGLAWQAEMDRLLGDGRPGLLDFFFDRECQEQRFQPAYFELAFGKTLKMEFCDPQSQKDPVTLRCGDREVRFRGKVDRVDVAGGDFRVLDYKTGSGLPTLKQIEEGFSFQLPIYILAVEALLKEKGLEAAGAAFYELRDPARVGPQKYFGIKERLDRRAKYPTHEEFRRKLEESQTHLASHLQQLETGAFATTERKEMETFCRRSCDFRRICRKWEKQMR